MKIVYFEISHVVLKNILNRILLKSVNDDNNLKSIQNTENNSPQNLDKRWLKSISIKVVLNMFFDFTRFVYYFIYY